MSKVNCKNIYYNVGGHPSCKLLMSPEHPIHMCPFVKLGEYNNEVASKMCKFYTPSSIQRFTYVFVKEFNSDTNTIRLSAVDPNDRDTSFIIRLDQIIGTLHIHFDHMTVESSNHVNLYKYGVSKVMPTLTGKLI